MDKNQSRIIESDSQMKRAIVLFFVVICSTWPALAANTYGAMASCNVGASGADSQTCKFPVVPTSRTLQVTSLILNCRCDSCTSGGTPRTADTTLSFRPEISNTTITIDNLTVGGLFDSSYYSFKRNYDAQVGISARSGSQISVSIKQAVGSLAISFSSCKASITGVLLP